MIVHGLNTYAVVFFGALALALGLTPLVVRLARAMNLLDDPGVRKIHAAAIPRMGGLAIVVPLLALTLPVFALDNYIGGEFRNLQTQMLVFLGTSVLIFGLGLIDDIRGLSARIKFLGQLAAAAMLCASGVRIEHFYLNGSLRFDFGWFSYPLTILWIVGITNAVNLIDGLDGLAAGISLMTCTVIAAVAIYMHGSVMGVLMLGLIGSLLGFLVYNFNPAKIFLGDGGSLFLGYFLAGSSIVTSHKTTTIVALALPALALGIPIFDTLFSMIRRLLDRRSMFAPDREHVHHRLLAMGLDQRRAVLVLYGVTAAVCGVGLLMVFVKDVGQLVLFTLAMFLLLVFFQFSGVVSLKRTLQKLQRNKALSQDVNNGRDQVQLADLKLREATTFAAWWEALHQAAEALGFSSLVVRPEGDAGAAGVVVWRRPHDTPTADKLLTLNFQLHGEGGKPVARLEGTIRRGQSFEAAGRRAALFGRLLDEHGLTGARALGKLDASEATRG